MSTPPDGAPLVPRQAALARISSWLSRGGRFLLVTGSAGTGKSTLVKQVMSSLMEAKRTQREWAQLTYAEHYCDANNTTTIAVSSLLSNWSTQLCLQLEGYEEELASTGGVYITGTASGPGSTGVKIGKVKVTVGDESPADAFVRTISRPLERLANRDQLPPVLLAIDGIEEARDADDRNRILKLLAGLTGTSLPPEVKFLVTSRPDRDVRDAFEGVEQLDLDTVGHDDVAEYVSLRAARDSRFAVMLADHAQGNFLLAATILDELVSGDGPITETSIRAMPRAMPAYFRERLRRIPDVHAQKQLDVLGLLAIARAPLREAEIATLLELERRQARSALNTLLPVMVYESTASPTMRRYRLFHRSFAEFLLDPDENELPLHSEGSLHQHITDRIYRDWANHWEFCDEPYAIQHVVAHLTLAITTAENTQQAREAEKKLTELVLDPGFLHAKAAIAGIDGIHADLMYAVSTLPNTDIRSLDRLLLRQAHHLRDWDPQRFPGLFTQQLHHDAVVTGNHSLVTILAAYLDRHGLAHLRLQWASTSSSPRLTHTLIGHRAGITAVAVTPDATRAITASEDATARVWDLDTGRLIHTLTGHENSITAVVVSPDGTRTVTASSDTTARVWDLGTGRLIHILTGHEDMVTAAAITAEGTRAVTTSWDRSVRVWDLGTGHAVRTLKGHQGRIEDLALAPDGHAITASGDGTVRVWDLNAGRLVHTLAEHKSKVTAVGVVPDSTLAISVSDDATARVWDLQTGHLVRTLTGHEDAVTAITVTVDGAHAIIASDGNAQVWDLTTGLVRSALDGHHDRITSVVVTPDGTRAITTSDDGAVRVWDLTADSHPHTAGGHRGKINALVMTPDGRRLLTASDDGTARIWDSRTGRLVHTLAGHRDWVTAVAVCADGTRAVTTSWDRTARVWDLETGRLLRTLTRHHDHVTSVAVTPDGTRAITTSWDQTARVWDLRTGRLTHTLRGHDDWVSAVTVVPDATRVITASDDGTARVWDLATGDLRFTCSGHRGKIIALAVTPDGTRAITTSRDGTARMWDLRDGHLVHTLAGHEGPVTGVAVDRTGVWAVTVSDDGTASIWDLRNGQHEHTVEGHSRPITTVAITPDGEHIITASDDLTARVWNRDLAPDRVLYAGQSRSITCLAVRPHNPREFIIGTSNGGLFSYFIQPSQSTGDKT